ncbi:MAG: radical SAM protein [bacterium]|nr:radical SAM protein [bacterium]
MRELPVHDYTILKSVRAVCPKCFAGNDAFDPEYPTDICDGHLVERAGRIYLRRFCRRGHGDVWSLYEESADLWRYLQQWRVPTKVVNPDTSEIFPVPMGYEHGLGPAHLQHSCIYLLDITSQCNLSCPACFAQSSPEASLYLPFDQIVRAVETAIERENGRLDIVMLSGGEPTVHPQLREIVERLATLPVTRVVINTNGIRLAADDGFLEFVASHRDRVEIYLQYDGQRASTHEYLRGSDLRQTKSRVVERLSTARIFTTLAMTVAKHNADQIGEVLDTAFATPYIGGVMFQPIFGSGRAPNIDPMDRVTTTGVLARIEAQSRNGVRARDLIALPCSHPDCCSIGYFIRDRRGSFRSLASVLGEQVLQQNLSLVGNTIVFGEAVDVVKDALTKVMSETMTMSRPELIGHLRALCSQCDLGLTELFRAAFAGGTGSLPRFTAERVKRVTIKHFMDADMLIAERLEQCCVHVAGAGNDPVRMPFCAARLFPKVRARAMEGMMARTAVRAHVQDRAAASAITTSEQSP